MDVVPLAIPDVKLIKPACFADPRGRVCESYSRARFAAAGFATEFVQDNRALSRARGTVRGLHFQRPPFAQAKLIQVLRGAIFDVAVDLRPDSRSFGRHVAATLTAEAWAQLFIPEGFAHGYCALAPDTEVVYKLSQPYSRAHEDGLRWNDPALAIPWPVGADEAILSDRDRAWPLLDGALVPASMRRGA